MKALSQYIELYRNVAARVAAGSAGALNAARPAALEALRRFGSGKGARAPYPEVSDENLFAPDYGINIDRLNFSVDVSASFRCDVPNISTLLGVVVNDVFRPSATLLKNCPEGVEVMSLARAAATRPELVEPYYNRLAADSSPAAALNTLLAQDGVLVYVPRGVRCDKPVQLVNIFNADMPLLAMRRILVVAEEGAALRLLICDHTQRDGMEYLSDEVIEVFAAADSHVEVYDIGESSAKTRRVRRIYARQQARSYLSFCSAGLSAGISASAFDIDVAGPDAETYVNGLAIASADEIQDTSVTLRHNSTGGISRQLFKYALFDRARGAFGGKIIVAEGAVHTDAQQSNRNIVAGDGACMASAPQLEIYCDDVKCSHGSATGQLDSRAVFYMQTRGIPEAEARMMLTQAFMSDVLDAVSFDIIRDRLRHLVEKRLCGAPASCAACSQEDDICHS